MITGPELGYFAAAAKIFTFVLGDPDDPRQHVARRAV